MVKNNLGLDIKMKCLEQGLTQAQLGEAIDSTGQYVNRLVKNNDTIINKTFIKMFDALGYDIELVYVPKTKSSKSS